MNAPCKDCANRRPHCHGSCKKYIEFCRNNERLKTLKQDENAMRGYQYETKMWLRKHNDAYKRLK